MLIFHVLGLGLSVPFLIRKEYEWSGFNDIHLKSCAVSIWIITGIKYIITPFYCLQLQLDCRLDPRAA